MDGGDGKKEEKEKRREKQRKEKCLGNERSISCH